MIAQSSHDTEFDYAAEIATGCLHIFPDGTRCTLDVRTHRGVVGLSAHHGFPPEQEKTDD